MGKESRPFFYPVGPNVSEYEHRLYMDKLPEVVADRRQIQDTRPTPIRP